MKNISTDIIISSIKDMCIKANCILNDDIYESIKNSYEFECSEVGKNILKQLIENADIAKKKCKPICQDTGMAIVFADIGQDVHITGGSLEEAINEGVRQGYIQGYLRKSVVSDPIIRINTNDNTPAIIHYNISTGDKLKIILAPKGFGSENMSKIYMLKPADGVNGIKNAVLETIEKAGANACPPMVVGVGIGGNFELSALLSKKALLRNIGEFSSKKHIRDIEKELLLSANKTGIGPQGLGGKTTVLGVNIESYATHIAGMPVAVNISCHVTRHTEIIL